MLRARGAASRIDAGLSCWLEYRKLGTDFDVVEIADWMGEGWLLALMGSRPLVAHLHSPHQIIVKHSGLRLGWDGFLSDRVERASVRRVQVVTSPSKLLANDLKRIGWVEGEVRIVRNPIDYARWAAIPLPGSSTPIILFVGRLDPLKAPETLLEAAGRLAPLVPGLEVNFVGRSGNMRNGVPYSEWLQARAAQLGVCCRFPGTIIREELSSWYASSRLVVVPSAYDNFPMAALEGMAAGRPLVCTSSTGVAEILEGTQAGRIVPPGDPDALAAAIMPYVIDASAAHDAGSHARQLVRACCAPERIAEERELCYYDAIERWRHSG